MNNLFHKNSRDESRATTLSALSLIGSFIEIALNPWIGSLGDQGLVATGWSLGIALLVLYCYRCIFKRTPKLVDAQRETMRWDRFSLGVNQFRNVSRET